jgi:hypothetical protein
MINAHKILIGKSEGERPLGGTVEEDGANNETDRK